MKIMIDTNILISSIVFKGKVYNLVKYLLESEHEIYVSEYVEQEFKEKIYKKWTAKAELYLERYQVAPFIHCESTTKILGALRDKKDIPVLSDAIFHNVDILLTGDKDFLESGIKRPKMLSPTILIEYLQQRH